jgi:hypothetical protein
MLTVNVGKSTDEQLKLPVVEDLDQRFRDDVVEALQEGVDLLLN